MHYAYPASWVKSGKAVLSNHDISSLDAYYMLQMYPPPQFQKKSGSNDDSERNEYVSEKRVTSEKKTHSQTKSPSPPKRQPS